MPMNTEFLTKSIVETIWLWKAESRLSEVDTLGRIDGNYFGFDLDWFKKFRLEWQLSRALRKSPETDIDYYNISAVKLLNSEIQAGTFAENNPVNISAVSRKLIDANLTPLNKHQQSMVSKIAFFSNPNYYVPMDRLSKLGIWSVTNGHADLENIPRGNLDNYTTYMERFINLFDLFAMNEILTECERNWVVELMNRNSMQAEWAVEPRFLKKAFDTYLMQVGKSL